MKTNSLPAAAFILLYETSLSSKTIPERSSLDNVIDEIRRLILLSRAEAQVLLKEKNERTDEAACVLAYEGIGRYRTDPDYIFSFEDILLLSRARKEIRMSLKHASRVLLEHRNVNFH